MKELDTNEIELVSGGETAAQRDTIGTGIILGGIATADPLIIALGVLYLSTN